MSPFMNFLKSSSLVLLISTHAVGFYVGATETKLICIQPVYSVPAFCLVIVHESNHKVT